MVTTANRMVRSTHRALQRRCPPAENGGFAFRPQVKMLHAGYSQRGLLRVPLSADRQLAPSKLAESAQAEREESLLPTFRTALCTRCGGEIFTAA